MERHGEREGQEGVREGGGEEGLVVLGGLGATGPKDVGDRQLVTLEGPAGWGGGGGGGGDDRKVALKFLNFQLCLATTCFHPLSLSAVETVVLIFETVVLIFVHSHLLIPSLVEFFTMHSTPYMSWTVSGITLAKAWVEEGSGQMLGWWKVLGYVDIDMEERRSWRIDSGTLRAVEEEDRTMS